MSAFASSSRMATASVTRHARLRIATTSARRGFASTSAAAQREVALRFGNVTATFALPSLPAWMSNLLPAAVEEEGCDLMPALAGFPIDMESKSSAAEESALTWDGLLHAAPKSKTTHSAKRMRSANKGLKDRFNLVHCAGCGRPKLAHNICPNCYGLVTRMQKAETRTQLQEAEEKTKQIRAQEIEEEEAGAAQDAISTAARQGGSWREQKPADRF